MRAVEGDRIAQLADGRPVTAPVTARFTPLDAAGDLVEVELVVDVDDDGRVVVTSACLIGSTAAPVRADALRAYSLNVLAAHALRPATLREVAPGVYAPDETSGAWSSVVTAVRLRQLTDDDRLEAVAAAFREGGIEEVVARHHRSRSQAYRLVQQARDAGYDTERNR